MRRLGQLPIKTWQEMKSILQEKYMLPNFCSKLPEQLANLQQGSMWLMEYVDKFDDLMVRNRAVKNSHQTIARFMTGLRDGIRQELHGQLLNRLEDAYEFAICTKRFLQLSKK